ncbi:hypothetical protein Tco_1075897 [Tanacetum coccineum]
MLRLAFPPWRLLKEHFDEVQISLVKKVRAMKAVFENIEAEVDPNDVFYTVTDYALTVSRFHDLSNAYNVAMTRAVELEAENSKLLKNQNDDHDTMIKDFSKLEIAHLNLQLKHQHLKENIENFKSKSSKDVPEFDAFFELGKRDDHIQGHKNTIPSDEISTFDYKSLDSQNLHLIETVTALQEQLEHFKAKNEKNLKTQLKEKMPCITSNVESPKVSKFEKYAIKVESIPPSQRNNRDVHHNYLNHLRDTLDTLREIVKEARSK